MKPPQFLFLEHPLRLIFESAAWWQNVWWQKWLVVATHFPNFVTSFLTADADDSLADLLILTMIQITVVIYDDHDHSMMIMIDF